MASHTRRARSKATAAPSRAVVANVSPHLRTGNRDNGLIASSPPSSSALNPRVGFHILVFDVTLLVAIGSGIGFIIVSAIYMTSPCEFSSDHMDGFSVFGVFISAITIVWGLIQFFCINLQLATPLPILICGTVEVILL